MKISLEKTFWPCPDAYNLMDAIRNIINAGNWAGLGAYGDTWDTEKYGIDSRIQSVLQICALKSLDLTTKPSSTGNTYCIFTLYTVYRFCV